MLILTITIVVGTLVLIGVNLRQRTRRAEYWNASLLSSLATLAIGLKLLAGEVMPQGRSREVVTWSLLALTFLFLVLATIVQRRERSASERAE